MNKQLILNNILRFVLLIALQIFVLNNVYLGRFVTPYVFIMFIILLPLNMNKNLLLIFSFLAGFIVDIFSNTIGFHSLAATCIAFLRILFVDSILSQDRNSNEKNLVTPIICKITEAKQLAYSLILIFSYNLIYFSVEIFNISDIWEIILSTIINSIVTYLLVIILQKIFLGEKKSK